VLKRGIQSSFPPVPALSISFRLNRYSPPSIGISYTENKASPFDCFFPYQRPLFWSAPDNFFLQDMTDGLYILRFEGLFCPPPPPPPPDPRSSSFLGVVHLFPTHSLTPFSPPFSQTARHFFTLKHARVTQACLPLFPRNVFPRKSPYYRRDPWPALVHFFSPRVVNPPGLSRLPFFRFFVPLGRSGPRGDRGREIPPVTSVCTHRSVGLLATHSRLNIFLPVPPLPPSTIA